MLTVDATHILSHDSEGDGDDMDEIKAKSLFFCGSACLIGSLFVSMLKLSDTYIDSADCYPGIALVIQSLLFIFCNFCFFAIKAMRVDDSDF